MLDRLESAVGGQRQLLDDVGHEMRTPLTVVRGHLELMDPADSDDVAPGMPDESPLTQAERGDQPSGSLGP